MFRELRRKDYKVEDPAKIKEIMDDALYGVLSTSGTDGYAYGVPLNFAYFDDAIYMHCAADGQKIDNIVHNNKVSFCVVGRTELLEQKFTTNYESVIAFGKASLVEDADEKLKALNALIYKYSPNDIDDGLAYVKQGFVGVTVFKIAVEHIAGKAKGKFKVD